VCVCVCVFACLPVYVSACVCVYKYLAATLVIKPTPPIKTAPKCQWRGRLKNFQSKKYAKDLLLQKTTLYTKKKERDHWPMTWAIEAPIIWWLSVWVCVCVLICGFMCACMCLLLFRAKKRPRTSGSLDLYVCVCVWEWSIHLDLSAARGVFLRNTYENHVFTCIHMYTHVHIDIYAYAYT